LAVLLLVAMPFLGSAIYQKLISPNPHVKFAGGFAAGRYDEFVQAFVTELNENSGLNESTFIQSDGSYANLLLLKNRDVDFALFQSGSDQKEDLQADHRKVRFISNIFPEIVHLLVSKNFSDERVRKLDFTKIAIGLPASGDYRSGMALVSHLKLDREGIEIKNLNYTDTLKAFKSGEIDLAILNVGLGADVIQTLVDSAQCRLIDIPMRDAFLAKHVAYNDYTIPEGTYYSPKSRTPAQDLKSVAVHAQLLTHQDVSSTVVSEVLKTLHHSKFVRQNRLRDLFVAGNTYALKQPEFPLHTGAARYYDPHFRPWINPDFVDATEGIRSFVFSGLIGIFLLFRWLRVRNERSQAHKLDLFIHRILAIEQEQIQLDRDYSDQEIDKLETYLDEITELRRQALLEFTAHELNDDPAIECFINMSHALSEKINSKLTRDSIRKNRN
ncbi:MAG: TAXI family TRAP transporter solute-binding subunit, partial [Planctomycetota bacterium]|nr:TAXI family TRAP transporter solute-binding subunit [Planctomycetota bacterium]